MKQAGCQCFEAEQVLRLGCLTFLLSLCFFLLGICSWFAWEMKEGCASAWDEDMGWYSAWDSSRISIWAGLSFISFKITFLETL